MRTVRALPAILSIGMLLVSAVGAGELFFVLWRDYLLYGVLASIFLLSGGAALLPNKGHYVHALSLGLCIGAFIGSGLGAAALVARRAPSDQKQSRAPMITPAIGTEVLQVSTRLRSTLRHPSSFVSPWVASRSGSLFVQPHSPNPSVKGTPRRRAAPYVER